mmetsp:Transcript_24309/g.63814  ORF Transcript_24309/g.63814 Transcript_24309/m.63814 type:complete len:198 (+) Transcript_24309:935-1528(+)
MGAHGEEVYLREHGSAAEGSHLEVSSHAEVFPSQVVNWRASAPHAVATWVALLRAVEKRAYHEEEECNCDCALVFVPELACGPPLACGLPQTRGTSQVFEGPQVRGPTTSGETAQACGRAEAFDAVRESVPERVPVPEQAYIPAQVSGRAQANGLAPVIGRAQTVGSVPALRLSRVYVREQEFSVEPVPRASRKTRA